jgi:hypothetical protein
MRAPRAFDPMAVDKSGPVQPLGVRNTSIGQSGRDTALDGGRCRASS